MLLAFLHVALTGGGLIFTLCFLAKLVHSAHLRRSNMLTESMAIVVVELSVIVLLLECVVVLFLLRKEAGWSSLYISLPNLSALHA